MRYAEPVWFCKVTKTYDAETGDYTTDSVVKSPVYASIINTSIDMMQIVYGAIKQGSLTIQLQNHYTQPFDYIECRGKIYNVDTTDPKATKDVLIISEAAGWQVVSDS